MSFPQSPLGIKVQLNLQGLGWTNIVRDNTNGYRILMEDGIQITRGHSAEQQRTTGSTMDLTLLDPNGVFNNLNPRSPYYGILPRNMPIRAYVQRPTVSFFSPYDSSGYFSTPSSTGINIAGDVDVIVDCDLTRIRNLPFGYILASKWNSSSQRSWTFRIGGSGRLAYVWSTDGSANYSTVTATAQIPTNVGRIALRVFHDVVDGTNNTVTFSWAPTAGGSFTTIGTPVTTAGTTSVFASTAPLEIGSGNGGIGIFTGYNTSVGRIYSFRLQRAAATVAQLDFTGRAVGTTSYVDPNSNTWTLNGGFNGNAAEVTDADYRFYGEVSSLPQTWDPSGKVVKVALEAAGVIRRLSANATPQRSPIYRNFSQLAALTGYWTGEDGDGATSAGSSVTGSRAAPIADITFSGQQEDGLPGSAGAMVLGGTGPSFVGIPKSAPAGTFASFTGYFKFPSVPLSNLTLVSLSVAGGTAARVDFVVETGAYRINAYDANGTLLASQAGAFAYTPTVWTGIHVYLTSSGGTVTPTMDWYAVGSGSPVFGTTAGTTFAGTTGRFSKVSVQGVAALSGVRLAHFATSNADVPLVTSNFVNYSSGYAGETAGARWLRILADAGVSAKVIGATSATEAMGPQPIDTTMNILYECVDVDGGEIIEPRDRLGLDYRSRVSMVNQYGLGLSYGYGQTVKQLSGQLAPVPDDLDVANDITLSRKNGSSVQVTLDSGPMSTLDPTLGGIGRVQSAPEINNYSDDRLLVLAQYLLGLSTWPEARYPTVQVAMHRISAFSFYDLTFTLAANTDVGDLFGITNLPPWLPPEALVLIARGQSELITQFTWDITFNATPGRPFTSTNNLSTNTAEQKRADSSNTVLAAAVNATAITWSLKTTTGALCVTTAANPAEFPFDVMAGGERVTITAITGTSSPQSATVIRSVNGIVKSQTINTAVVLPSDTAMLVDL